MNGLHSDANMPSTHLSLNYHLVFAIKNLEPIINVDWEERLHNYTGGTVREFGGQFSLQPLNNAAKP